MTVLLPSSGGLPALRLGTQELTRCGMQEEQMGAKADILDHILLPLQGP